MPIRKDLYESMQRQRDEEHRAAERDRRRSFIATGLMCIVWAALGLVCYAFAFHTTDAGMAEIYKRGAYLLTYGGVSFTLLGAYRKGERRGDW